MDNAVVNLVTPDSGAQGHRNLDVVVQGVNTNFAAGTTTADFGAGVTVKSVSVASTTQATVRVNVAAGAAPGARDVKMTTGEEVATKLDAFDVRNARIVSVDPTSGAQGQTMDVEITGADTSFGAGSTADFGSGIQVNSTTVIDATNATANITIEEDAAAGARDVNVVTGGETPDALQDGFNVRNARIVSVTPEDGAQGETMNVTITGKDTRFVDGESVARFSGSGINVLGTTVLSNTKARARITITKEAAVGARDVNVETNSEVPDPLEEGFTVRNARITEVSPDGCGPGNSVDVTITGVDTDFVVGESEATFSGDGITVNSTTVTSATQCTASITIASDAAIGDRDVNVVTGGETPDPLEDGFNVGAASGSRTFYFAEGTTRSGFTEYISIMNANDDDATVNVTYMLGDGSTVPQVFTVQRKSRTTVDVVAIVGADQDVSARVTSDVPIVAERPMYFNYAGAWPGGHDVIGATSTGTEWYFAEGTTREGFDEYICIQNPGQEAANVEITYMMVDGTTDIQPVFVGATSRVTVDVAGYLGRGIDCSARVTSDQPIVVERPMYFAYAGAWTGGHDVVGATEKSFDWYFAEGTTRPGFDEYICLQNPNDSDALVNITYMLDTGENKTQDVIVIANSRLTLGVWDTVGRGHDVSMHVHADHEIVAERPMYFDFNGITGGHDVLGATHSAVSCSFAEGTTRSGFTEYISIQNPNDIAASIAITYMLATGVNLEQTFAVGAKSRSTVNVGEFVGSGQDVSARVSADLQIIAERPMYFTFNGLPGGHDVVGFTW